MSTFQFILLVFLVGLGVFVALSLLMGGEQISPSEQELDDREQLRQVSTPAQLEQMQKDGWL